MTACDLNSPSPTADLHQFLVELHSPVREAVILHLYMFFQEEVELYSDSPPEELLEAIVAPAKDYEIFTEPF